MISEDEDNHLLSTGCPNQREQKISCVLKCKQSHWTENHHVLAPLLLTVEIGGLDTIEFGNFLPLILSPLSPLHFYGIILLRGREKKK